jgi:hypothetical protein
MIIGAHILLYSKDADADRQFLSDVIGLASTDVGGGWLIFGLPPAELAVHPRDGAFAQRHAEADMLGSIRYLRCDDLESTMSALQAKGAACSEVERADWGRSITITLPSGGSMGLYQPAHRTMI